MTNPAPLPNSDSHSLRMIDAHQQRDREDMYARLKQMFLEEHPKASAQEFEDYSRLLAKELRL